MARTGAPDNGEEREEKSWTPDTAGQNTKAGECNARGPMVTREKATRKPAIEQTGQDTARTIKEERETRTHLYRRNTDQGPDESRETSAAKPHPQAHRQTHTRTTATTEQQTTEQPPPQARPIAPA